MSESIPNSSVKPTSGKISGSTNKRAGILHYLALALLVALAFGSLLRSEVIWSEYDQVKRSSFPEMSSWTDAWTLEAIRMDDPITLTSYFLEQAIPLNPMITQRAINLFLHFIAAVIFLNLLQALKLPGAFLATLLFALHPVAVQTLLWPGYRHEIIGLLLIMIALHFGIRNKSRLDWVLFFVIGSIAALSHPSGLLVPLVMAGIIALRRKKLTLESFNPILPLLLSCLFIGMWIDPILLQFPEGTSIADRSYFLSQSMYFHIRQAFLPIKLDLFYPAVIAGSNSKSGTMALLPFLLFVPMYVLIFLNIKKHWAKALGVGLTGFLLALLYGLLQAGSFLDGSLALEDHTLYIAVPAIAALSITGLIALVNRADLSVRILTRIALGLVAIGFFAVSATFSFQVSDTTQMWKRLSEKWPESWIPEAAYLEEALKASPPLLSVNQVIISRQSILEKNPSLVRLRQKLAYSYAQEGQLTNAIREYNRILREENIEQDILEETATFFRRMDMTREFEEANKRIQQLPKND